MQNALIFRTGKVFREGSGASLEVEAALGCALCRFLNTHHLVHQPLTIREPGQWDGFELRLLDLTDRGLAVMRCGLDKWMKGLDRGKDPADTRVLENCLAKIKS